MDADSSVQPVIKRLTPQVVAKSKPLAQVAKSLLLILFGALLTACSTGRMEVKERHYYEVRVGGDVNYYRLDVYAETVLGDAEYRSGWFPAHAVDSLFGDVTAEGGAKALEARQAIEADLRESIQKTNKNYLEKAADPTTSPEVLEKYMEARRRVLAYPRWDPNTIKGAFEVEYNPSKGVATRHKNDKLVFVLSSDPNEVVGKIANFAESDKTVLSINRLAKVISQRARNQLAEEEATEEVNKRIDKLIQSQIQKAYGVLGDKPSGDPTHTGQVISEVETLLRLLDSVR